MKHIVSVLTLIDDLDKGVSPSKETLNAKFTDNINYLLLLEGLIAEREGMIESQIYDLDDLEKHHSHI
jgi:hypothetical protein